MPDLADLFPGFAAHWIDTSIGKIFARVGRGFAVDSGHYLPEENPAATAKALLEFFAAR